MKMIKKTAFFSKYDFEYEEAWLNDMAAEGKLFRKLGIWYYYFEESGNTGRRFRVILKKRNDFEDEELDLFQSAGWNFAGSFQDRSYFYTDDPDAEELFTDEDSRAFYYEKTRKKLRTEAILFALCVILWGCNLVLRVSNSSGMSLSEYGYTGVADTMELISPIFLMILFGYDLYITMQSRRDTLREKRQIERKEYRHVWHRNMMVSIVAGAMLIVMLGTIALGIRSDTADPDASYDDAHPVLMREVAPKAWDHVLDVLSSGGETEQIGSVERTVKYEYSLGKLHSIWLHEGYEESVSGADIEITGSEEDEGYAEADAMGTLSYDCMYLDFRSENRASRSMTEQIERDLSWASEPANQEASPVSLRLDAEGADDAFCFEDDGWEYLYLRKGTKVIYAYGSGEADLKGHLELYLAQLQ